MKDSPLTRFLGGLMLGAAIGLLVLSIANFAGAATPSYTPAASDKFPPTFLPGVALYVNHRFVKLIVGSTRFTSCHEAVQDTQTVLEKYLESEGQSAIGMCVPIPTYSPQDLVSQDAPVPTRP